MARAAAADSARALALVTDAEPEKAARHGLHRLREALEARGWSVRETTRLEAADSLRIVAGTAAENSHAARLLREAGVPLPAAPEALVVKKLSARGRTTLVLCGADARGLMYAALDAAERVAWAARPADPLADIRDASEQPAVAHRALSVHALHRGQWESRFHDERHWTRYLDLLAGNRFNRLNLVLGSATGGFLAPAYPYFFDTPGFPGVRMTSLTPGQQARNLAALNRLIDLAHDRGIAVGLGLWDHLYRGGPQAGAEWMEAYADRPIPGSVEGLTTSTLEAYTVAALRELLDRVPALDALQVRFGEESGVQRDEAATLWRGMTAQVRERRPGLRLELLDDTVAGARTTPVDIHRVITPWGEQMGLPYAPQRADLPPFSPPSIWRVGNAGTTRLLLWGDPEYVRRYSSAALQHGSSGWDVQEPLATKMAGQPPDLTGFNIIAENYRHYDYEFERYWHFFHAWGHGGYNPATSAVTWERAFRQRFGPAGPHLAAGLQRASQVLPMIVAAIHPSRMGAAARSWPERQSLGFNLSDYAQNEGLDPAQFESFADAAGRVLENGPTARRTPEATSRWFDAAADAILASVRAAEARIGRNRGKEFEATVADLQILAQLARFHARRILSAMHYNLFKRGLRLAELVAATYQEREVVAAWRELVAVAGDRYAPDLAMGPRGHALSGHWRDELKLLEFNLRDLEEQCCPPEAATLKERVWKPTASGDRAPPRIEHERVRTLQAGEPFRVVARAIDASGVQAVRLHYRSSMSADASLVAEMQPTSRRGEYTAILPATAVPADSRLFYSIEAIDRAGNGALWPDLTVEDPYIGVPVLRK